MSPTRLASLLTAVAGLAVATAHAEPLGTAFTYQGELQDAGAPTNGVFDLEFAAYTQLDGGTAVQTLCANDVTVTNGRFNVLLDFGPLPTSRVYLGLRVRPGAGKVCGDPSGFTALLPRQEITPTPFATYATKSGSADTLNGQPAAFYTNASNIASGTLPDERMPTTVARTWASQTYTGVVQMMNGANRFAGSGFDLFNLNASNMTFGTLSDARLSPNIPRLNGTNTWAGPANTFNGDVGVAGRIGAGVLELGRDPVAANNFHLTNDTAGGPRAFRLWNGNYGSGTHLLSVNQSGRVGIGTTAPATKLAIEGNDASGPSWDSAISIRNTAPSGGFWSMNALANPNPGLVEPGSMAMYNSTTLFAMLTQSGKLGINGVFNPQATLDVNGQIYSRTGGIKFPDGSVQTTASNIGNTAGGVREFITSGDLTIPAGVTVLEVELWGGGGGGGTIGNRGNGGGGGSGAYIRGRISVTPNEIIRFIVGQPGLPGFAGSSSRIIRLSNSQVLAEAGGGGGGNVGAGGAGGVVVVAPPQSIAVPGGAGGNPGGSGSPFRNRARFDNMAGNGGWGDYWGGSTYYTASTGSPTSIIVEWR